MDDMSLKVLNPTVVLLAWGALSGASFAPVACADSSLVTDQVFASADRDFPRWQTMPIEDVPSQTSIADEQTHADLVAAEPAALAVPEDSAKVATPLAGEQLDGMLGKLAWFTGAVGLTGVVSLWLLRLWFQRREAGSVNVRALTLVDSLRVGPRCGLYLVQADHHRVLVGIDQGRGMSLLALPSTFSESLSEAADEAEDDREAADTTRVSRTPIAPESFGGLATRRLFSMGGRT
jgi:flagellar biogenesis protein FliO